MVRPTLKVVALLALAALPSARVAAQEGPVSLVVTAPNQSQFRVVHLTNPKDNPPLIARGTVRLRADSGSSGALAIAAGDSAHPVHVEVYERGRVILTGNGTFITVRRDSGAVSIEARNKPPASFQPGEIRKP